MYLQVQYSTGRFIHSVIKHSPSALGVDAEVPFRDGKALIVIKRRADAMRTVRTSIMGLAYTMASDLRNTGYVVLVDSSITAKRLDSEWKRAAQVLRPDVLRRLTVCLYRHGELVAVPHAPPPVIRDAIKQAVHHEQGHNLARHTRIDYSFVILKVLINQWLTSREPVTADWLGRTAGCSFPTVSRILKDLGSVVERTSDRRIRLRYFPRDEFERLVANSATARSTVRFADRSGQPRRPEDRVRRLEKLQPPGIAIGGVLGARHYCPELDLVGTPRLDLSMHCQEASLTLDFVQKLDPALQKEDDPHKPASVVVHAVRHADPLFQVRQGGLFWADPVECLLDLREARLESQAAQFLDALTERRTHSP